VLSNVGCYFGTSSYYSQKTKVSTGQSVTSFGNTAGIHLHMTDPDGGDNALTSVGFPDGSSASVYSAKGYSEYTVKYWNSNGSISEYEYDADEVDPGNARYLEMLAFTSHLDLTGQTKNAFGDFISAARGVNGDITYNSENILSQFDFRQMTEDFMGAQYRFGNMAGYLSVKNLYDHMMPDSPLRKAHSRDTFDEFCEFMDKMYAEQRANAPEYRNQFLEMVDQGIQQKNGTGLSGGRNSEIRVSNFKEVETANYKLVPEPEIGGLRILVDGKSAGVFKPEHLKIQEDAQTGTRVMISELPGFNGNWYDAIPVTEELESALSEAIGVEEVPHQPLEGYYIGTHAGTGIKYVMRPGDEGRGGQVLLCNAVDEARYKALGEEYARRYPNLVTSPEAGEFYASLEIRGMAQRGANGIITTHPDNISYNDNSDPKKNWSAMIDEKTWNLLLSWLNNHTINTEEMTGFKYWDNIFNEIGGSYERVWSDDEIRQGHLYQ